MFVRRFPIALLVLSTLSSGSSVTAAEVDPVEPPLPETLTSRQPAFYVRAWLNHANGIYHRGEEIILKAVSEADAYLYVLYRQTDNQVYQLFPNSAHPDNRVRAGQVLELGGPDDLFRWAVGPPFGKEAVTVVASKLPIEELSRKEQIARQFNPVTPRQLKGVEVEISEAGDSRWVSTHVPLETRAEPLPEDYVQPKRIGLFVGITDHLFEEETQKSRKTLLGPDAHPTDAELSLELPGAAQEAGQFATLMKSKGRLDDLRVLTNEQATRANLEEAITQWLPRVSSPGDTIFVTFAGHTGQIPDDNGDEQDDLDELLTPYDSVEDILVLMQAGLADKENKLPRARQKAYREVLERLVDEFRITEPTGQPPYLRGLLRLVKVVQDKDEEMFDQMQQVVWRSTGISDDVMGNWLQRLDGRRVIIVLDTCHAGGHSTTEKGIRPSRSAGFRADDFLDNEAGRLKDLGQRDLALLASSSVTQVSWFGPILDEDKPRGFFGGYLLEGLEQAGTPMTVEELFAYALKKMRADMANLPEKYHQYPQLFNDLTEPVYFRW